MAAIILENIEKSFRDKWMRRQLALHGVSLEVAEGEAFGFIGPNGAGKSTTIKILTGAIRPDSGNASLFGVNCLQYQARKGLGYVPENPYLPDYLTPMEILQIGIRMHGLHVEDVNRHCMHWLERFDIARVARKKIRSFSKGMTQRTALAHALAMQPRLLILDEPLSGLDPIGRRDVVDELMAYRRQGGTIFFSSHVLHDVERLADRFGLIYRGTLRTVRSPADLAGDAGRFQIRSRGNTHIEGMTQDVGERWLIECTQADVFHWLQKIEMAKHQLIEVRPSLSLESAFFEAIGHPHSNAGTHPATSGIR